MGSFWRKTKMTTQYTKNVRDSILEVAEKCKNITEKNTEVNIWLGLPKGRERFSTYFVPDIYFVMKNARVFIFQLCDSQSHSQKEVLGDLFSALLAQEVTKVYFIVPPDRESELKQVTKVVLSILKHKFKFGVKKLEAVVYSVPKLDKKHIKRKIVNLAMQEKWGYENPL